MVVNNFFGHWIKDIDIRRYPGDTRILPTNNSVDVYQYSPQQLKYLPETSLYTATKKFLYSRKSVYLEDGKDRRDHTNAMAGKRTDLNLTDRIADFKDYILKKNFYRIPLGFLVDLGLIIFSQ